MTDAGPVETCTAHHRIHLCYYARRYNGPRDMIGSFANRGTEDLFDGVDSRAARATCPQRLWARVHRKLDQINGTASVPTISIVSVSNGRRVVRRKSKSRTTTRRLTVATENPPPRLPRSRPPTHPGEMLLEEFLKPLAISQSAFAVRLGVSFPRLNEVVRGKRAVTPDTALRLAQVLGTSADMWLRLQQDWDLWHVRRTNGAAIANLRPIRAKEAEQRGRASA